MLNRQYRFPGRERVNERIVNTNVSSKISSSFRWEFTTFICGSFPYPFYVYVYIARSRQWKSPRVAAIFHGIKSCI